MVLNRLRKCEATAIQLLFLSQLPKLVLTSLGIRDTLKPFLKILVNIRSGTRTDAEWLALTANQKHGLRRTNKDKQLVVRQALLHPYGVSLSNREIARHCGVSDKTVGKARREMELSAEIPISI